MYNDYGGSTYSNSIYSPETAGVAAAENAIVIRQQEHQQMIVAWEQFRTQQQTALEAERQQIEGQRAVILRQQAENWTQSDRLRSEKATIQHELAVVKRDHAALVKREQELQKREDLRRRNRTTSFVLIEDSFSTLSAKSVLEHLTHSSARVRKHAMDNISSCIGGFKEPPATFARFEVQDIAPHLISKLHQLVSTSKKPVDSVVKFCEDTISSPPVAKALALSGECPRLADLLVENNEIVSNLAICSLRQMISMDVAVVKATYSALALAIPHIPVQDLSDTPHPAVKFVQEMTPKIISDCFSNALWSAVAPLVTHRIESIRKVALRKIVLEAQNSDRTRHGLVEVHTMGLLDQKYQSPSPPPDVVSWFVDLLPLLAEKMCRHFNHIIWMTQRINDPNTKIQAATINALRSCASKEDPAIHNILVKADLLKRLADPAQQSKPIIRLLRELLPILAIPYTRAKAGGKILAYLEHSDIKLAKACLAACKKIIDSTPEDRAHIYPLFSKLNFSKESALQLCDHAMPVFCKDWAAAGDFTSIAKVLQHPEQRLRKPAHHVWREAVISSPAACSKIAHDNLLDIVFDLCNSQYEDAVVLGAGCLSPLSIHVAELGVTSTQRIIEILNHPKDILRKEASRAVQVVAENSDAGCTTLLSAGAFNAIKLMIETYPADVVKNIHKLLVRLAPFLSTSPDACSTLVQLLDSKSPQVEAAARAALASISFTNIKYRETLRKVILDRLLLASDAIIEYSASAIQEWIGSDLAELNDFSTFFNLALHSNKRIQTAALLALKQKLQNKEYQESLEKANITYLIRSLAISDTPEAINFVVATLTALASTLARKGHISVITQLLISEEPKISAAASLALETVASGSAQERKCLLDEDVLERFTGDHSHQDQTILHLLSIIISKLAIDYLHAGRTSFLISLVNHRHQQIRTVATKVLFAIASGEPEERNRLRDVLLQCLPDASDGLRTIAAGCLSRSFAFDLLAEGKFSQIFRLFENNDPRIRAPMILELQKYIQASDEISRRRLVDADIIPSILQTATASRDDIITLTTECILPILGPAITQNDGGASVFPLLSHEEPRIRAAAVESLRNGIDSRHGNIEKMTRAGVVSSLQLLIDTDNTVRDLWCHILPKAAPYMSTRGEIDIIFESLSDAREVVREAASGAVTIMAKKSEGTRLHLFPVLMRYLDDPPPLATKNVAQAVALSGSAFVSNGNEGELIYLIQHGKPALMEAAVEAVVQIMSKGSSFEHHKLMDADIFSIAVQLHEDPSRRIHTSKLLPAIIIHLGHAIILDERLTRDLFSLFSDPDLTLSQVIYQTLVSDPRISGDSVLPELLPILLVDNMLRNVSVVNLLQHLAPLVVLRLIESQRVDIIVTALKVREIAVVRFYLQETCACVMHATEAQKGWVVSEPSFVPTLGKYLKSQDVMLRRVASEIVEVLSSGSPTRSGRMMEEGIGGSLAYISVNGEKGAQRASLHALSTLFLTAPDHADRLVEDCLPALCDILEDTQLSLDVYTSALHLLTDIATQSSHYLIIECGIVAYLIAWLSPQHSMTNPQCRESVFRICHLLAQTSDHGRKALIDEGALPVLLRLSTSNIASNVINSCKIVNALAYTGTFMQDICTSGLKNAMEHITSPFRRSSIENKADKKLTQEAAKGVLSTLKSTKTLASKNITQKPSVIGLNRSSTTIGKGSPTLIETATSRSSPRRTASEHVTHISPYDEPHAPPDNPSLRPRVRRVMSESGDISGVMSRRHQLGLSVVREDQDYPEPGRSERETSDPATLFDYDERTTNFGGREASPQRPLSSYRSARPLSDYAQSRGRFGEDEESERHTDIGTRSMVPPSYRTAPARARSESETGMFNNNPGSSALGTRSRVPPSYRTVPSTFRSIRPSNETNLGQETIFSDDGSPERRPGGGRGRSTAPPSYRTTPSALGTIRRPR